MAAASLGSLCPLVWQFFLLEGESLFIKHLRSLVRLFIFYTSLPSPDLESPSALGFHTGSRLYPRTLQKMTETAPSSTLGLLSNPQVHLKCLTTALVHTDLGFSLKKNPTHLICFWYFKVSNNEADSFASQTPQTGTWGAGDASLTCWGLFESRMRCHK